MQLPLAHDPAQDAMAEQAREICISEFNDEEARLLRALRLKHYSTWWSWANRGFYDMLQSLGLAASIGNGV